MNSEQFSYLLMGLPATGKTTFLAALWYVVQETAAKSELALDHVVGDTRHLNDIRDHWLRCTAVPRTFTASEVLLSMHLKERASGRPVVLHVPDLAGELFELQWSDRQWPEKYDRMLKHAGGALLFVHPEKIQQPTRIDMIDELAGSDPDGDKGSVGTPPEGEWQPHEAPTQVKLVELLQFIATRGIARVPFRVAVVVSAWDKLAGLHETPAQWLRHQLPLLDGVLRTRGEHFPSTIYGLSAQGGEYQTDATDPLCKISPLQRIHLVGESVSQKHDITEPVRWLMR